MSLENVKYDAFISYRHCDLDQFNAMSIQRKLENFKLPKSLRDKTGGKTKIERVFRDQDELPLTGSLSDSIEDALKNSDFLIVICTPRLSESQWCAKEIETFIKLHDRDHVLAVLAEGEPESSFPDSLRFAKKITLDELGNKHEETVEIEPLAADTRGADKKEIKKNINDAVIRLAAPIFGLNYDDIKQRHKEQRTRKIIAAASVIASVFFVFALICMGFALRISSQKNTIEEQYAEIEAKNKEITQKNDEITKKNDEITEQNLEISKQNEEISKQYRAERLRYAESMADIATELLTVGRKSDALYALKSAMPTTQNSTDIPYCAATEKALTDVLGIYNRDLTLTPTFQFDLLSTPKTVSVSPDGNLLAAFDSSSNFYVFDTTDGSEISRFRIPNQLYLDSIDWISDTTCIYAANSVLHVYTASEDKSVTLCGNGISVIDYVISHDLKKLYIYVFDATDSRSYIDIYSVDDGFKRIGRLPLEDGAKSSYDCSSLKMGISESDTFLYTLTKASFEINVDCTNCILNVFDLTDNSSFSKAITLYTYCDSYITDDELFLSTAYNQTSESMTMNSVLFSLNPKTGETNWEKEFVNCFLGDFSYGKNGSINELILDAFSQILVLDAKTGEEISSNSYDGQLVKGFLLQDKDFYNRLIITDYGNLLFYLPVTQILLNKTGNYYKYLPSSLINDCCFHMGYYYFCYSNESYIAGFCLTDNYLRDAEEIFRDSEADAFTYNHYCYSDDYRYTVMTYPSDAGYKHVLYDRKDKKILCKLEDKHMSAGFLSGVTDKFYTYSTGSCMYSFSGELLNSVEPYTVISGFFLGSSNSGKYLLYSNRLTGTAEKEQIVFSPETASVYCAVRTSKNANFILADDIAERLFVIDDSTVTSYSFSDPDTPIASIEMELNFISKCFISADGKYLFFNKRNNDIDVYESSTLRFVKTLYCTQSSLSNTAYLADTGEYLLITTSGVNCILNDNLECTKVIFDCVGYDSSDSSYITLYNGHLGSIKNASYEELIKMADEELNGFESSDFIKDKYHIR